MVSAANAAADNRNVDIVTHDGVFHADELCAVATLALADECGVTVTRTRAPAVLALARVAIVDVGAQYAPETFPVLLDHHQWRLVEGDPTGRRPCGAPLAAFGLAWQRFGREAVRRVTREGDLDLVEIVWQAIDKSIVAPVDAADVGQAPRDANVWILSRALSALNPGEGSPEEYDAAFHRAALVAATLLEAEIQTAMRSARDFSRIKAMAARAIAMGERVLVLDKGGAWQGPVIAANAEAAIGGIDFAVYADPRGQWMVQSVPPEVGSFAQRVPLPAAWAAKRDAELATLTGVADAVFCHAGRFIAGAATREGARTLAEMALAAHAS
jgi:uncharacterized UPF0160 family protein